MEHRNDLQADIEILMNVASRINENTMITHLNELSTKLTDNRFYLVVLGLFKRGKSSLINALVKKELVPISVTPLTSVITFFNYAESTYATVVFENGKNETITIEKINEYVSEELNPKNIKKILSVNVYHKSEILKKVTLVDTPGIGSLFSHNSDTTMDFLPRIDAAIFVTSADIPLSKADGDLLHDIKDSVTKVIFVLNKSDLLNEAELNKISSYNLKMLSEILQMPESNINLIPVSAKTTENENTINGFNNISALEKTINNQIIKSKDDILQKSSNRRIFELANHINTLLNVKTIAMKLPLMELEKKRDAMQNSFTFLHTNKDDFDSIVKGRIHQLHEIVTQQSHEIRNQLTSHCNNVLIKNSFNTWEKIKKEGAEKIHRELHEYIIDSFQSKRNELEVTIREDFHSILRQYSTQSHSFLNQIIVQMREILDVDIDSIISNFDLDIYTSFYFKDNIKYSLPKVSKKQSLRFIPEQWKKRKILDRIHSNCKDLINPNAGRMRSDITYKIDESYRKFRYHFDQKIVELLQSIKDIIDESINTKQKADIDLNKSLTELEIQKKEVNKILNAYSKCK